MTHHKSSTQGFALLMTLLVVTVVVSITVTVIELSIQQLNLSVTAKDSEIAFHAANSGMECALYARRMASSSLEAVGNNNNNVPFACFELVGQQLALQALVTSNPPNQAKRYRSSVSWPTGDRCSEIDMLVITVPDNQTADTVVTNLDALYKGYTNNNGNKNCGPGGKCTVAQVTGYNQPCANINKPGTVRREILLEF